MSVECYRFASDDNVWIAFNNHAIPVARHRAGAFVANAGDAAIHYKRSVIASNNFPAMTRAIAHAYHAAHNHLSSLDFTNSNTYPFVAIHQANQSIRQLSLPPAINVATANKT